MHSILEVGRNSLLCYASFESRNCEQKINSIIENKKQINDFYYNPSFKSFFPL